MQLLERCKLLERGIIAGKKAERFAANDTEQLSMQLLGMLLREGEAGPEAMPEEPDVGLADLEDEDGTDEAEPGESCAPRRRRGRRTLPEALPRVEIEVLPPEVLQEGLERFERIGQEVSEVVERRPSLVVARIVRPI